MIVPVALVIAALLRAIELNPASGLLAERQSALAMAPPDPDPH